MTCVALLEEAVAGAHKHLQRPPKVGSDVEMMGLIGMGNNPMVGATVACSVAVYEALKK